MSGFNLETRISRRFAELRATGRKALMPYLCAGDPNPAVSYDIIRSVCSAGADLVELGIPFSDPVADGPVIQTAARRALSAGTTPSVVLDLVSKLRQEGLQTPIVLMTYYNLVFRLGVAAFCRRAAAAGADGLIVPDLPLEEAGDLWMACREYGLNLIPLLAPTAPPPRVAVVCGAATGFIYCVARTGVTGADTTDTQQLGHLLARARRLTDLPLAVGFGVTTAAKAAEVGALSDGVIVGSAVVRRAAEAFAGDGANQPLVQFIRELRTAIDAASGRHPRT